MSDPTADGRLAALLEEQLRYYRDRAPEYDEWFERGGRYDRGVDATRRWHEEIARISNALEEFGPRGDVLEIACGTGLWTQRLINFADRLTALDAAPEMIELAKARIDAITSDLTVQGGQQVAPVKFVEHDVYTWRPDRKFDVVFAGFFLSHVPPERFEAFWHVVDAALAPEGRFFFIDSAYTPQSTAVDHVLRAPEAITVERSLSDGRRYEIVKVFYDPDTLAARLAELGWTATVRSSGEHFIYGFGRRAVDGAR